jgi:hypothetical protein
VVALCALVSLLSVPALADAIHDCHIGSYRLADGTAVDIAPFGGETGQLHPQKNGGWTSSFAWTNRADGKIVSFADCTKGQITFGKEKGRRIAFDIRNTTFVSRGVKLAGRLVMPEGADKVPVVVPVRA